MADKTKKGFPGEALSNKREPNKKPTDENLFPYQT